MNQKEIPVFTSVIYNLTEFQYALILIEILRKEKISHEEYKLRQMKWDFILIQHRSRNEHPMLIL